MKKNQLEHIISTYKRIKRYVRNTPLEYSDYLSEKIGGNIFFKLENLQHTGSFKLRGALAKVSKLNRMELRKGVITASAGNHALGVCFASEIYNTKPTVIVPKTTPKTKLRKLSKFNVRLIKHGNIYDDTEREAIELSKKEGLTYISPYNDIDVICGQATLGIEIYENIKGVDYIITPLGGGGLISGIALHFKRVSPRTKIIGVEAKNSPPILKAIQTGQLKDVKILPTIADGLSGNIEKDSITFPIIKKYADDVFCVTEREIKSAIFQFLIHHHQVIEGSAAVTIAGIVKRRKLFKGKTVVGILTGANIDFDVVKEIIIKEI